MTVETLISELAKLDPLAIVLVRNKDGYLDAVSSATATPARQMKHWADYREANRITGDDRYYAAPVAAVVIR